MLLTQTLVKALNRVFDRTPGPATAFAIACDGTSLSWSIADGTLTTTVTGGTGAVLSIDLSLYTVATLAAFLAQQTGYIVTYSSASPVSSCSALCLVDGTGDQSTRLAGYTNPVWAWLDTVAKPLTDAEIAVAAAPAEMDIGTADGEWLDFLGDYYKVPRLAGELDTSYGPRIISTVIQPTGNNIALELILESYSGHAASVVDVTDTGAPLQVYNAAFNHDASHVYDAYGSSLVYCLFDVTVIYAVTAANPTQASFEAAIRALIEKMRSAGTHLRNLTINAAS